jgi:hypothetical protein
MGKKKGGKRGSMRLALRHFGSKPAMIAIDGILSIDVPAQKASQLRTERL